MIFQVAPRKLTILTGSRLLELFVYPLVALAFPLLTSLLHDIFDLGTQSLELQMILLMHLKLSEADFISK